MSPGQRTVTDHDENEIHATAVGVADRLRADAEVLRRTAIRNAERHPDASRAIAATAEHLLLTADALVHFVDTLGPTSTHP